MQYKGRNCSFGLPEVIPFLYLWKFVLGSITGLGRYTFYWIVGFTEAEEYIVSQGHDLC